MLVSLNWLKELVDIEMSAEETAELLTMGGTEVEGISHFGDGLDKVFTAKISDIAPHPSADKLRLARASLGDREEWVVCGAPNIAVGQVVPYAAPGAILPSGMEISRREIRGVSSAGMICSEKELGLGEDASGILIFGDDTSIGRPLAQAIPEIEDQVLDVSLTPNRGDCLSVLGIAREVAALAGTRLHVPEFEIEEGSESIHDRMTIEVPDYELCPRYVARLVDGVTIRPSPFWMRLRLARCGMRPISNVVDATNYILWECGQPLHAFDYEFLDEAKIVVKRGAPGETFVTLDDMKRTLPEDALMIMDGKKSVALAGIMGGLNSEIQDTTTSVLIESACFERFGVRKTSKTLGMGTEASHRFERGVDPEGSLWAAHRAAYLIQELAGGTILSGVIDVYPEKIERPPVTVRTQRTNLLLGTGLDTKKIAGYLERLGIKTEKTGKGEIAAVPPSWRWDLEREEDMIEEVARVYGFQNIPVTTPVYRSEPDNTKKHRGQLRRVNEIMNASGYSEVITMSFVSGDEASELVDTEKESAVLPLLNPLTEDLAVMRKSLLPGLIATAKRNISRRSEDLRLYEIGRVFLPIEGEVLPYEEQRVAGLAAGARYPDLWHYRRGEVNVLGKIEKDLQVDFYDVKGAIENLLEGLGVEASEVRYEPSGCDFLHPGKSADLYLGETKLGFLGELSPVKTKEYDLRKGVQVFEILLEPLFVRSRKEKAFRPIPRYPYIERDLSIIVEEKVSGDFIKHLISQLGHDIISSVILFDFYRGEPIPADRKSLAFRIRYRSEERTLTDEEVEKVHSDVLEALTREVGASLRE